MKQYNIFRCMYMSLVVKIVKKKCLYNMYYYSASRGMWESIEEVLTGTKTLHSVIN